LVALAVVLALAAFDGRRDGWGFFLAGCSRYGQISGPGAHRVFSAARELVQVAVVPPAPGLLLALPRGWLGRISFPGRFRRFCVPWRAGGGPFPAGPGRGGPGRVPGCWRGCPGCGLAGCGRPLRAGFGPCSRCLPVCRRSIPGISWLSCRFGCCV
ncbi:hypothetical protein, partial [Desulfosporosinus metallidurans]|uniref:hypothetical protein n=1 Tax=Desulfosporosinus metallidurans TaxID=1888891 RepID=UPI001A9A36E7